MIDCHAPADSRFRPRPSPDGGQAWEYRVREHILGKFDWCVFGAGEDGRLVGQEAGVHTEPYPVFEPGRCGGVMDMVVEPAARRRGVGGALSAAPKAWSHERGADHLELRVAHRTGNSRLSGGRWVAPTVWTRSGSTWR